MTAFQTSMDDPQAEEGLPLSVLSLQPFEHIVAGLERAGRSLR